MKILYTIIFFCLIIFNNFSCTRKIVDCSKFRNGKFTYYSSANNKTYFIERTDTIQIETDLIAGKLSKNKIIWLNPCEYNMIAYPNNEANDTIDKLFQTTFINVKIIEATADYYIFASSIKSTNKELTLIDTMKIKK